MLRLYAGALAAAAVIAIAGCGNDTADKKGGDSAATASAEPMKVAYSNPIAAQPGQQSIVKGFEGGAKELGWTASSIDANLSADKQVADIATMITQKQNGIATWTLDPGATAGAYGQAQAAKIPVIGLNSEGTGIDATVWWEINTCNDSSPIPRTAEYIARVKPHGKVLVIGGPPVPSIQAYVKCFTEAAGKQGLEIVAHQDNTKDTSATAQPIVADMLTKHGKVDAIWSYNDASALGASAAVVAAGQKVYAGSGDGVIITGQNGDKDAIAAIQDGRLTGTWDPETVATGWALIKALSNFIGAKKVADPPKTLVVKSTFWTKENVADYKPGEERGYTLATIPVTEEAGK